MNNKELYEEGRIPEKKSVSWLTIICIGGIVLTMFFRLCSSWINEQDRKKAESTIVAPQVILEQDQEQSTIEKWQELYILPQAESSSDNEQ